MSTILKTLQQFDIKTLEELAGTTIVRAVKSAYDTNRERELAKLIIDRYGAILLKSAEIRNSIIDRLPRDEAHRACLELDIAVKSPQSPYRVLQNYFTKSFTQGRSREFVSVFHLGEDLIPPVVLDDRSETVEIDTRFGETATLKGYLHPYQRRVKDKIAETLWSGVRRVIAQMPTGAGKTVTALELIVDQLRRPNFRNLIVWIVDSNELADQALESFAALWKVRGDRPIRAYRYFSRFAPDFATCAPGVVFASFPKVNAAMESTTRELVKALADRAALVIVDEAHTSIAETYEQAIHFLTRNDAPLLGLTATPGRNDLYQTQELARLYGNTLVSITDENGRDVPHAVDYLRDGGYLADIEFEDLQSGSTVSASDETQVCTALAENAERNEQIVKQIERAVERGDATVVFACTKDHVLALVALCRAKGIEVGFIIGEVPQPERLKILDRFRAGELRVIINHEILSTGVDMPNTDRLIITRPVGSAILYSQILGRALRGPKNGGNSKNTVVNIHDNLANFATASHVYQSFKTTFQLAQ